MSYDGKPVAAGEYREIMRGLATGVTVVTAHAGGGPAGTTVNSFTSVSLEPPLALFCISHDSRTWPVIEDADCFAVSFLCADQEPLARRFAAPVADRFAGQRLVTAVTGAPILADAAGYVDCELANVTEAGDHLIAIGSVVAAGCLRDSAPLIFADGGYRSV
jgi:3-hydroxy-9,10-secoandrosta-1,3,5(10)-triene-9,17-dione monooxygenase reductase component